MSDQNKPVNYAAELNREIEILDYKSMMQQEREKGREETILKILRNMVQYGYSEDEALRQMGIPEEQWDSLKEKLN
ncbi:hypothetical protein SAMN02745213_01687 [Succinivibrio dextrinosolvens DSM 3072]|uniref:Uncharacterized protein n=1 Tax=Succinivibrio dextrinosolvens DSM 3072 TaxID=1123324 RepID=A0A1T4VL30_9GAMM|nr:hypothetical protein [Succinivibrio dextrinosolvens]SKA65633.1 hypothetical protein SAMN02745213_01687 [Succinivibrio dextrinosolvens DSM 3072]